MNLFAKLWRKKENNQTYRSLKRTHLNFDCLEQRVTPANFTFTPLAASTSWTVANNWRNEDNNTRGNLPTAIDDITIPNGETIDMPDFGRRVRSLTVSAGGTLNVPDIIGATGLRVDGNATIDGTVTVGGVLDIRGQTVVNGFIGAAGGIINVS